MGSEAGRLTTWFLIPFRKTARLVVRGGATLEAAVVYDMDAQATLPNEVRYSHARYREEASTFGYAPYLVLDTQGEGISSARRGQCADGCARAILNLECLGKRQ